MSRLHASPNIAMRLLRACLIALYASTALLGSGGLHALAPQCCSDCPAADASPTVHSHHGCTHSHPHRHQPADDSPQPHEPCQHTDCLICEFAATPALSVAVVTAPSLLELRADISPALETHAGAPTWSVFLIRGPPAIG